MRTGWTRAIAVSIAVVGVGAIVVGSRLHGDAPVRLSTQQAVGAPATPEIIGLEAGEQIVVSPTSTAPPPTPRKSGATTTVPLAPIRAASGPFPTDGVYERRVVNLYPGADVEVSVVQGLTRSRMVNFIPMLSSNRGGWRTMTWAIGDPAVVTLAGVPVGRGAAGFRVGSIARAEAKLIVAWVDGNGGLAWTVVDTAYVAGTPARPQEGVQIDDVGVGVFLNVTAASLEYSGMQLNPGVKWELDGPPPPARPLDLLFLDRAARQRHPVRIAQNRTGELFAIAGAPQSFLPAAVPAVGMTARYDDIVGAGTVVLRRDTASTFTIVSAYGRFPYSVVPEPFADSFADCPVVFLRMVENEPMQVRCFDVSMANGQIASAGFRAVALP